MNQPTDWDAYYQNKSLFAGVTRSITQRKICRELKPLLQSQATVCEMGGANSCVLEAICRSFDVKKYHVIDTNSYGLSLLPSKSGGTNVTCEQYDILRSRGKEVEKYDLIFSIGLIEHFDRHGTQLAIQAHLDACKPGGIILITFPTPTLLYRSIRMCAEFFKAWQFPDERPLKFDEILDALEGQGTVMHQSINWFIGLTQGYVIFRKAPIE